MCAYNAINSTYCSENKELLTDILRKDWGYEGMVVTDWGAVKNRVTGPFIRFRSGDARRSRGPGRNDCGSSEKWYIRGRSIR